MSQKLDSLSISGFKSIQSLDNFELNQLNILIGANGAGKSNFIALFRLLRAMVDRNLQHYVLTQGGADGFFFNGPQVTKKIEAEFKFGRNSYAFELQPSSDEQMIIVNEKQKFELGNWALIGVSSLESSLPSIKDSKGVMGSQHGVGYYVHKALSSWTVYHFHDTSNNAPMRRSEIVQDTAYLRPDAANIAPFLLSLREQHPRAYISIVDAVRLVTPFFDRFELKPVQRGEKESVNLSWQQRGSDYPMQPYHFSDGTLRFICLVTALLQPNPPSTIIIDEPELGLHPYAIGILAELIQTTARHTQVVISTQSPTLINHFDPADLITVNRQQGASTFDRLDDNALQSWLDDYSLGELWQKNIVSGGPANE